MWPLSPRSVKIEFVDTSEDKDKPATGQIAKAVPDLEANPKPNLEREDEFAQSANEGGTKLPPNDPADSNSRTNRNSLIYGRLRCCWQTRK